MTFKDPKIKSAEITPKDVFKNRRNLLKILTIVSLAAGFSSSPQSDAFAVGVSNKKLKAKFNKVILQLLSQNYFTSVIRKREIISPISS